MSVFPLNIETKVDHPDKLAKLVSVESKYYESATEINMKTAAIIELKSFVDSIVNGLGDIHDTRALAMAENPLPADGVPFVVSVESGHRGQYMYDSSKPEGYDLITLFYDVEENGIANSSEKLTKSKSVFDALQLQQKSVFDLSDYDNTSGNLNIVKYIVSVQLIGNDIDLNYSVSNLRRNLGNKNYIDISEINGSIKSTVTINPTETGVKSYLVPQYSGSGMSAIVTVNWDLVPNDGNNYGNATLPIKKSNYFNGKEANEIKKYFDSINAFPSNLVVEALKHFSLPNTYSLENDLKIVPILNQVKIVGADNSKEYVCDALYKEITVATIAQTYITIKEKDTSNYVAIYQPGEILSAGIHELTIPEYNNSGVTFKMVVDLTGLTSNENYASPLLPFSKSLYIDTSDTELLPEVEELTGVEKIEVIQSGERKQINLYDQVWLNHYKGILDSTPSFKTKLLQKDEDIEILMLGDSFFEGMFWLPQNSNPENLPPQMSRKHTTYYLWERIVKNKPVYDRYDSTVNSFTESGVFAQSGAGVAGSTNIFSTVNNEWWNMAKLVNEDWVRYSNTANAYVEFNWDLDSFEKLLFSYCKSAGNADNSFTGTDQVTITCPLNKVEYFNGTNWVEANGITYSQTMSQDAQETGNAWNQIDLKLKFRKKDGATGVVTMRHQNTGSNNGYFFYWGTARWNGASVFITNIARGGRDCRGLQYHIKNDIQDRNVDLVLFELPLTNEWGGPTQNTEAYDLDGIQHILYDGATDWRDGLSLQELSNNFTDFEVLCVIPHIGSRFIDSTNKNDFIPMRKLKTSHAVWQRSKSIVELGALKYVDLDNVMIAEAKKRGWNLYDGFNAKNPNPATNNNSFCYDDVHPNLLCCMTWARYLAPIFEI